MMNRIDFTPITTAMNDLTTAIRATFADVLKTANEQREEYHDLARRMYNTYCDMLELGTLVKTNGHDLMVLGGEVVTQSQEIRACIEGKSFPTCNYEDFAGYCDGCGASLVNDEDNWSMTNTGVFCDTCIDRYDDEDELYDEEDEEDEVLA